MGNSLDERLGKTKFGVFESALASLLFIIYNFIFLELYYLIPMSSRGSGIIYYTASFLIEFLFAVAAFTVAKSRKYNFFAANGMRNKINGKLVWLGFAISVVCLIFFSNLTDVFIEFLYAIGYTSQLSDLTIDTFLKFIIYVFISCLTPAICEEILFRGTILSGLKAHGIKIAVGISAVIFTLMHGNPEQTVHQFIIGIIIGYIFFKSGNLWLGVIIHFFNNFISVSLSYVLNLMIKSGVLTTGNSAEGATVQVTAMSLMFSLISAVIFAVLGYFAVRALIRKMLNENERVNGQKATSDLEGVTTINVDGNEVKTTMMIDDEELDSQDKGLEQVVPGTGVEEKTKAISIPTIVLFALSGAYLIFEWVSSLLVGIGIV